MRTATRKPVIIIMSLVLAISICYSARAMHPCIQRLR
jgi:hypothetical protein